MLVVLKSLDLVKFDLFGSLGHINILIKGTIHTMGFLFGMSTEFQQLFRYRLIGTSQDITQSPT